MYLRTLYGELCKTAAGKAQARKFFAKARAGYHPIGAFMALTAMREAGLDIK